MGRLCGRIAVVTGAGRGIGAAEAVRLVQEGAHVAVLDLIEERAREMVQRVQEAGSRAFGIGCDVSQPNQVKAAILDGDDPTAVLYRSPRQILEPEGPQETQGSVPGIVFPTATDRRAEGHIDVYYGAADFAIGVARLVIPPHIPLQSG